ncbi:hypothetical protein [Aquisphaera insulae]|uniref:hypothetical protein n=1 Tax=Aquisphaera insulae TaxID=2712864 RepID=UPI0013ECB8EE|nr:hypothetical protein [Aquisphaera insulae]
MRNTPRISLLGREARRIVLAIGLSSCSLGCHHHYYYYGNPPTTAMGCPPTTGGTTIMPSAVTTTGPVCDVPEGSTTRVSSVGDGRPSRVVVSEPSKSKTYKFGWRPSDPEETPTVTQVEGTLDGGTVKK